MEEKLAVALSIATGNDEYREWMHSRFVAGEYNAATDGHIIIGYKGAPAYELLHKNEVAKATSEWLENGNGGPMSMRVTAAELLNVLTDWPKTDKLECEDCNGKGLVLCTCTCGDDHDRNCMECDGKGFLTNRDGSPMVDTKRCFQIEGVAHFGYKTWKKVAEAIRVLEGTELLITHGTASKLMRMEVVGTPAIICVMPVLYEEQHYGQPFTVVRPEPVTA